MKELQPHNKIFSRGVGIVGEGIGKMIKLNCRGEGRNEGVGKIHGKNRNLSYLCMYLKELRSFSETFKLRLGIFSKIDKRMVGKRMSWVEENRKIN